jgi:hypothetical protein
MSSWEGVLVVDLGSSSSMNYKLKKRMLSSGVDTDHVKAIGNNGRDANYWC